MEIYEGQYTIHTDNVCICCLRSGNVYTEIFRFRVSEESYYLLNSFFWTYSFFTSIIIIL